MKKTVNVIERTLEKDKKDFITVCKIAECSSMVALAIIIVAAIAIGIMAIMHITGVADADKEFGSANAVLTMISNMIMLTSIGIALKFSAEIFNKLKTGDTPFQCDIADKIKKAGITLIAGTFASTIFDVISSILIKVGIIASTESHEIVVDADYALFGVVLMALAYIFNYGCKLQQESDETI